MEHSSYYNMVGVSSHFYKMVASLFLILDVLYIGQHLQSRGITEIRTPMAPPQEGPSLFQ